MTPAGKRVPTLTEVIEGAFDPVPFAVSSSEAMAFEDLPAAALLELLRPTLEAWVESQVRDALSEAVPVLIDHVARRLVQNLRAELPELLAQAQARAGKGEPR